LSLQNHWILEIIVLSAAMGWNVHIRVFSGADWTSICRNLGFEFFVSLVVLFDYHFDQP
jgi:hypothetical protein